MISKVSRWMLMILGAGTALSGIVNLAASIKLLEPMDAAVLGMSRAYILTACIAAIIGGSALFYLGWSKRDKS